MKQIPIYILSLLISSTLPAQDSLILEGFVSGYEGEVKLIVNAILPDHSADMENEEILYMKDGHFVLERKLDE